MFLMDDIEGGAIATVVVGVAAVLLMPTVLPVVVQASRPLLKGAVKGGILCLEKGREAVHEVGEIFEDVLAEVRAEMEAERKRGVPPAEPAEADELVEAVPPGGPEPGPVPAG